MTDIVASSASCNGTQVLGQTPSATKFLCVVAFQINSTITCVLSSGTNVSSGAHARADSPQGGWRHSSADGRVRGVCSQHPRLPTPE